MNVYAYGALLILGLMTALWLLSLYLRDASIVDIFWGPGFVITAWLYFILTPDGSPARKLLICILASLWGLRLGVHIFLRNAGKGEDFRYQKWRQEGGASWWWQSYLKVFLLQGVLMWLISSPLLAAQLSPAAGLTWLDYAGLVVWVIGFYFEALGDWQLKQFKSDPANKGKLLTSGVWRYTRHPNYFGDAAQWWGFGLIALAAGGWWSLYSPLLMTFLLVRVSGVALLEKSLVEEKPGYKEYVESTSAFIPWVPRNR